MLLFNYVAVGHKIRNLENNPSMLNQGNLDKV